MTMHTYHPSFTFDPTLPVLHDDCGRCTEHTTAPWGTLDTEHLRELEARGLRADFRSRNDRIAYHTLVAKIGRMTRVR